MSQANPTDVEIDNYAKEFTQHGDQTKSWLAAFPKSKAKPETIHVRASEFHKISKVQSRIGKVQVRTAEIAEKKFTITIEQRLKWLNEIVGAGLEIIVDASGVAKRQNLPASKSAIDTLNLMLGTDEESGTVKPVKVIIGVKDGSRP